MIRPDLGLMVPAVSDEGTVLHCGEIETGSVRGEVEAIPRRVRAPVMSVEERNVVAVAERSLRGVEFDVGKLRIALTVFGFEVAVHDGQVVQCLGVLPPPRDPRTVACVTVLIDIRRQTVIGEVNLGTLQEHLDSLIQRVTLCCGWHELVERAESV